jgi:hypothetical protein
MAYNWIVKGSEKHEFHRIIFEYYFKPLELSKSNLKTIKKQTTNKNKKEYEELFELYKHDECLMKAFKYTNIPLIKYLITLPDKCKQNSKFCSEVILSKVCTCSKCQRNNFDSISFQKDPFLFMAADFGNKEIVEFLCSEEKLDLNHIDKHNENILYYTTHLSDLTFIKWLINDKKVDYNITTSNKSNLLFKACISDNLNLVKYLIDELKFDIDYQNNFKQTCLYHCCHCKTTRVFDYLVETYSIDFKNLRDNYNITIMQNSRTVPFLEHMIKKYDYDIDHIDEINKNNILFYACSFENVDLIDYILKNSSSSLYEIDKQNNYILYVTLIILETYELSSKLIKKYKIDVNHQNIKGHNILFSAISKSNFKTAKWIIQNTDINLFHKEKKNYDIINDLIHYFDHEDEYDDFKDLMKYIFEKTDFKYHDKYLFDICCDKSSPNINIMILKFMIQTFKSNIRYTDNKGQDILIRAIKFDIDIEFIKYLITLKGVDVFLKDKEGKDAFYYAYQHKDFAEITYNIYNHKNNTLMSLIPKHLQLKKMYGDLLKTKHELETKPPVVKNTLHDSGNDLSFDSFNITEQDKISMFDDLLTYTTNLKLQVLTLGREPVECKNKKIDELV